MSATVLVVEDEPAIAKLLKICLEGEGYRVFSTPRAEEGLELIERRAPDLVILDVMLPRMDGMEMLRRLREEHGVPVLVLSAKREELDRLLGFRLGADDYVAKPFSVPELLLRVKNLLKVGARGAARREPGPCSLGALSVDLERHEVAVSGKAVRLGVREFLVLKALVEADGKVLSRERLLDCLAEGEGRADADLRSVDQLVARLRRKLGSERARIATVSGSGYRLRRP